MKRLIDAAVLASELSDSNRRFIIRLTPAGVRITMIAGFFDKSTIVPWVEIETSEVNVVSSAIRALDASVESKL